MDTTTNSNRTVLPRILQQRIRNTHTLRRPPSNRKNKQTNIQSILNRIKKHNPELRIRERRHKKMGNPNTKMTEPKPLKNKGIVTSETLGLLYHQRDIISAVAWLKRQIEVTDLVGKTSLDKAHILKKIDLAFPDITEIGINERKLDKLKESGAKKNK